MTPICLLVPGQKVLTSPESLALRPLPRISGSGIWAVAPWVTLLFRASVSHESSISPSHSWLHIVNHFLSGKSTREEAFQAFLAKTTHYDNFCSTVIYIISCSVSYSSHNIVKWVKILPTLATIRSSHNFISIDSLHIQTN